jgi:hypothetical protein
MKQYELNKQEIANLRRLMDLDHEKVKRAIFEEANRIIGHTPNAEMDGIFKYEGGVNCNQREIAIKNGWVADDWRGASLVESPEEAAVVQAIHKVAELDSFSLYGIVKCTCGDPLRDLYAYLKNNE